MLVIIKCPGKRPEMIEIDNGLTALQGHVGGRIEHYGIGSGIGIVCNEEYMYMDLPFNFDLDGINRFCGNVLFLNDEGEDFDSLTDKQCDIVMNMFRVIR